MPTPADKTKEWHCNACVKDRPELRGARACTCLCFLCALAKKIETYQAGLERVSRVWAKAVRVGGLR